MVCRYTMPLNAENGAQQHAPFWCRARTGNDRATKNRGINGSAEHSAAVVEYDCCAAII